MSNTIIDIIRHGEPEGGQVFRGNSVDDPLSERGWTQMWATLGGQSPWVSVFSSPMQRCQAFAENLSARYRLPLQIDHRLREVGFGCWEGQSRDYIKRERSDEYQAFYHDPVKNRPSGAEPLQDFMSRVAEALQDIARLHDNAHVLVVAHAGVIRAALAHTLQIPAQNLYRVGVDNAGLTRLRVLGGGWHLVFHNRLRSAEAATTGD